MSTSLKDADTVMMMMIIIFFPYLFSSSLKKKNKRKQKRMEQALDYQSGVMWQYNSNSQHQISSISAKCCCPGIEGELTSNVTMSLNETEHTHK